MIGWFIDSVVQWLNDSIVQWFNGSMVQWFNDSMIQWFNDSMVHMVEWFNDSLIQWFNDSMIQWFNDPMIQWFNDSTSLKTKLSFARSFPVKVNLELQNETIRTFPWCSGVPSSKLKANWPRGSWVIIGHDIIHYNPMEEEGILYDCTKIYIISN